MKRHSLALVRNHFSQLIFTVFALTSICSSVALAQTPPPAAPKPPPLTYDEQVVKLKSWYARTVPQLSAGTVSLIDQPYVDNGAKGISPSSSQLLDLFVPAGDGPFPVVVNIHGGGWHAGGKEGGVTACKPYLAKGIAYASTLFLQKPSGPAGHGTESQCMAKCTWTYLQRATLGSFGPRTEPKGSGVVSLDFEVAHLHRSRSLEGVRAMLGSAKGRDTGLRRIPR